MNIKNELDELNIDELDTDELDELDKLDSTSNNALSNYNKYVRKNFKIKTCRLSKREYEQLNIKKYKSSIPIPNSHKKKTGPPRPELVGSRDEKGNIFCFGCKKLIMLDSKDQDDDDWGLIHELEDEGGVFNCCYDCEFKWFCGNCSLITLFETYSFNCCGNTMMAQLLNPTHGGGRFSNSREKSEDYWPYLRKYFANDMKKSFGGNVCINSQSRDIGP